ncbi:MAG: TrkA family potassium uptake protein [Actinomycetia bacterium]|nr:TrkA family potassium uptake protein [Actinomycetes bacterium]
MAPRSTVEHATIGGDDTLWLTERHRPLAYHEPLASRRVDTRVVVAGCGRVGSDLALHMAEEGHDVSIIDDRPGKLEALGTTFNGTTHFGRPIDIRLLKEAGIEFADAFAAVTNSDNMNVMSVQLAKQVFGVPRTLARLDDPGRADSYRTLGISYVAGAQLTANVIFERLVDEEFEYHVTFSGGDVEVVEMHLGSKANGLTVEGLEVESQLRVAAVRRGDRTHIPDSSFTLREGDLVVAAARLGVRDRVHRYLQSPEST